MPSNNPINDGMMQLLDSYAAEKKAQLDLDVARAKRTSLGRTVVPDVAAALQQRHLKAEKQRQALREQGQAAPIKPSALLPQTVDPSGMIPRGGGGAAAGNAADLLKAVLGGGGVKRAGAPGAVANQTGALPAGGGGPLGTAIGMGNPVLAGVGQVMQQPGAPGQVVPNPGPPAATPSIVLSPSGVPGQAQATQTLTPGQQWLAGLTGALNIGARRPGEAIGDIQAAIAGKRNLGLVQVPTPQELALPHAQSLAELQILRDRSEDPEVQKQAGVLYDQKLEDLRQTAAQAGVDPDQTVNAAVDLWQGKALEINRRLQDKKDAELRADLTHDQDARQDLALRKDAILFEHSVRTREQLDKEERAAKLPRNVLAQQQLDAVRKFQSQGKDALSLDERGALPPGMQAAISTAEKVPISPTERSRLEQQIENARKNMNNASELARVWDPEYYGWKHTLDAYRLTIQQNAGIPLDPKDQAWLTAYRNHETLLKQLQSDRVRSEAGAQISPAEWKLMDATTPQPGDDLVTARARLAKFKEYWGLVGMREELSLETGYGERAFSLADEANGGLNFSDMSKMVETFSNQAVLDLQLKHPTMEKLQALDIVEKAVRNRWGLEIKNYLGTGADPALR